MAQKYYSNRNKLALSSMILLVLKKTHSSRYETNVYAIRFVNYSDTHIRKEYQTT